MAYSQPTSQLINGRRLIVSHLTALVVMSYLRIVGAPTPRQRRRGYTQDKRDKLTPTRKSCVASVAPGHNQSVSAYRARLSAATCRRRDRILSKHSQHSLSPGVPLVPLLIRASIECSTRVHSGSLFVAATNVNDWLRFSTATFLSHLSHAHHRARQATLAKIDALATAAKKTQKSHSVHR